MYIISMQNSNIPNVAPKPSPDQIYGDAGLLYIRYHVQIETKPNGQKNMGGLSTGVQQYHQTYLLRIWIRRLLLSPHGS